MASFVAKTCLVSGLLMGSLRAYERYNIVDETMKNIEFLNLEKTDKTSLKCDAVCNAFEYGFIEGVCCPFTVPLCLGIMLHDYNS